MLGRAWAWYGPMMEEVKGWVSVPWIQGHGEKSTLTPGMMGNFIFTVLSLSKDPSSREQVKDPAPGATVYSEELAPLFLLKEKEGALCYLLGHSSDPRLGSGQWELREKLTGFGGRAIIHLLPQERRPILRAVSEVSASSWLPENKRPTSKWGRKLLWEKWCLDVPGIRLN